MASRAVRILVVDDEELLAESLAEILRLQGHSVESFTDPRLALRRLESNSVDVLFTDLGMPELEWVWTGGEPEDKASKPQSVDWVLGR